MAATDDGNRQVALTLSDIEFVLGLDAEQFDKLIELAVQQDANLDGINGAIDKLAENVSEPDTSVAAEIRSLKEVISTGFADTRQSITDLNNTIHERSVDLAKWLAAIALAASTPEDNSAAVQAKIDELTALLKPEADAFEEAATKEGE